MELQNSSKFRLNLNDFKHLLKNVLIRGFPILLANIGSIQNWVLANYSVNPEVFAIIMSAIVKLIEYFLRNNQKNGSLTTQ